MTSAPESDHAALIKSPAPPAPDGAVRRERLAAQGMTVLRNHRDTLPLDRTRTVALIGRHAVETIGRGGGSAPVNPPYQVSVAQGLTELLGDKVTVLDGVEVRSAPLEHRTAGPTGHRASRGTIDVIDEAVRAASHADVAVIVVGLTEEQETAGVDTTTQHLPGAQDALIEAVAGAADRTVVVVTAATPVIMPWLDRVDAVIWAGLPGQQGRAVAAALLGDLGPTGRPVR